MGLLDLFGKHDVGEQLVAGLPFVMKMEFSPLRIAAGRPDRTDLRLYLRNPGEVPLLTSVVVQLPKALGFDQTGLQTTRELRLGLLEPRKEREVAVTIFSNQRTQPGEYPVAVTAFSHYRDYAHILNSVKKQTVLRAI